MKWLRWGANLGLKADNYPALDIDVDNEQLAKVVENEARKYFGDGPVRTSRGDRRLLVFRTDTPFKRIWAKITYKGEEHLVECLGVGLQYLVHGRHPSGNDYGWVGEPLAEYDPASLPLVDADRVIGFFSHIREKLAGRAEVEIGIDKTREKKRNIPPQEELRAPSLGELEALVATIPNDGTYDSRDDYITMGIAIKAAGGDEALYIFQEWCSRWEGGENDPDDVEGDWHRMHPPFTIGWEYLLGEAGLSSLRVAQEEFEADEGAVPPPKVEKEEMMTGVIELSDTWVVEKLAGILRKQLRFVPETGNWHIWAGHAWIQDRKNLADHLIRRALVRLSSALVEQAKGIGDEERRGQVRKFAASLQTRNALTKALPELQAHPRITLLLAEFDSDPWALNTPSGIVDLRTGELLPSDPSKLHSRSAAVAPKVGKAPNWESFLQEATGGDKDLQRFLQKQVGYSLTANTQEQTLVFIHGPPLTGKSVFIETIGGIFGSYRENAPMESFTSSKSDRHPTDLAKLAGSRLVTAVETAAGRSWDSQRIKSLTGGDVITARFLHQNFFDYKPTFKIVIVGNHEPIIQGTDEAMMRRLRVVPFESHPLKVDRLLGEKLKDEWPQILQWAIEGCLLWLKEGLSPPEVVVVRTATYSEDENLLRSFFEDKTVPDSESFVSRQELYDTWANWCRRQGEEAGSSKEFLRNVRAVMNVYRIAETKTTKGGATIRGFKGIKIIEEEFGI